MEKAILPISYFPPIHAMAVFVQKNVEFEAFENYQKQTFRNRAWICDSQAKKDLSVSIDSTSTVKIPIQDIKVSYKDRWNYQHWKGLITAYNSSPFFEYFKDDLHDMIMQEYDTLFELCDSSLKLINKFLRLKKEVVYTKEYIKNYDQEVIDLRERITPPKNRIQDPFFPEMQSYYQVFDEKNGFIPHLSILDLLFNEGDEALSYLKTTKI